MISSSSLGRHDIQLMEIGSAMNTAKRAREKYRKTTPASYTKLKHLLKLFMLTMSPIPLFIYLLIDVSITWQALLAIPIGIVFANFVEYASHRWPMHRKYKSKWATLAYRRHAGTHHAMFQFDDMNIEDPRDWYHVMMSPRPAIAFMFVVTVIVASLYALGAVAFAPVLGITLSVYFFSEELLHLLFHLESTWAGRNPFTRMLRRLANLHHVHHETKLMRDVNFNICIPLFDVLFGTYVRNRRV